MASEIHRKSQKIKRRLALYRRLTETGIYLKYVSLFLRGEFNAMTNLCRTCLAELERGQRECPICHTKVKKNLKLPFQLLLFFSALALIISSTIFYLRWHYSAQKTEDSFYTALASRDASAIKKLTMHEDFSAITLTEANAIIELAKTVGEIEVDQLFSPVINNNVTQSYKMTASTVSVAPLDASLILKMPQVNPDKLVPGKYKITVINDDVLRSNYTEELLIQKKNTTIPLLNRFRKITISDTYRFPLQAYNFIEIAMNGKSTSLDEIIQNEPITIFDYMLPNYEVITHWPWGTTKTASRNLVESISLDHLPYIEKSQSKQLQTVLQKTIENLSEGIPVKSFVTEHFKSFPPKMVKPLQKKEKITAFDVNDLTVDAENTINGIYTSFSVGSDYFNAHFVYDQKDEKWQLNALLGEKIKVEDSMIFKNSNAYTLARMQNFSLTSLNDGQLQILFNNVYSIHTNFPANYVAAQTTAKVENKIAACSKSMYYHSFKIQKIEVLSKEKAEITSLNTCTNKKQYQAKNLLIKNGYNEWLFQELKRTKK